MYDNIVMSEFTYADGHKESIGRTERSNSWFSKLKSSSDSNPNTQSVTCFFLKREITRTILTSLFFFV